MYHAAADLMKFGKGRERRSIHEISADELEKYIDGQRIQKRGSQFGQKWGLSTRRTNMSLFSSLWEVAIAKGWATLNIVDRLEPVGRLGRQKRIYPNETTLASLGQRLWLWPCFAAQQRPWPRIGRSGSAQLGTRALGFLAFNSNSEPCYYSTPP